MSDRYTIHGDGTVTDTKTGLMWEYEPPTERRTWDDAHTYCAALQLGGHTDWRLPTIEELCTIIDYARHSPACALPTVAYSYWSATTVADFSGFAWLVDFNDGLVDVNDENNLNGVRAVRAGSS